MLLSLAHILQLRTVPEDDELKNNVGVGHQAVKYSDPLTPNHMKLKGPGSGTDPWQSWRVAATLGPP